VAEATGTTAKTLRFYERQGLLPVAERTPAGYRDYTPATIGRLDFIRRGQAAGLTLAQIRQILDIRDGEDPPVDTSATCWTIGSPTWTPRSHN